jgi:hypothetical protein
MRSTSARASRRARRAAAKRRARVYVSHDGTFAIGTFEPVADTKYRQIGSHKGIKILADERMPLPKRLHVGLSIFGRLIVTGSFFDGDFDLFDDTG